MTDCWRGGHCWRHLVRLTARREFTGLCTDSVRCFKSSCTKLLHDLPTICVHAQVDVHMCMHVCRYASTCVGIHTVLVPTCGYVLCVFPMTALCFLFKRHSAETHCRCNKGSGTDTAVAPLLLSILNIIYLRDFQHLHYCSLPFHSKLFPSPTA